MFCSEFLLVCQKTKDMHIWIEHFEAQNTELALTENNKKQKLHHPYIMRMRLQTATKGYLGPKKWRSVDELNSDWLKRASFVGAPGEVAATFRLDHKKTTEEAPN